MIFLVIVVIFRETGGIMAAFDPCNVNTLTSIHCQMQSCSAMMDFQDEDEYDDY